MDVTGGSGSGSGSGSGTLLAMLGKDVWELATRYKLPLMTPRARAAARDPDHSMIFVLQPPCDVRRCLEVLDYISRKNLNISAAFQNGGYTSVIRALTAEKYFEVFSSPQGRRHILIPATDPFTEALRDLDEDAWITSMTARYNRRHIYSHDHDHVVQRAASEDVLEEFTRESVSRVKPIDIETMPRCGLLVREKYGGADDFVGRRVDFEKLAAYQEGLRNRILPGLPWLCENGDGGAVVAGEALEMALLHGAKRPPVGSNPATYPHVIHVFVVCPTSDASKEARKRLLIRTIASVIAAHNEEDSPSSSGVHVSETTIESARYVDVALSGNVKVRVSCTAYASLSHLMAVGFDIDSSRIVYDGNKTWAHATAMRAWRHGWNLFDVPALVSLNCARTLDGYARRCWGWGMNTLFMDRNQLSLSEDRFLCRVAISELVALWRSDFTMEKYKIWASLLTNTNRAPMWARALQWAFGHIEVLGCTASFQYIRKTVDALLMFYAACEIDSVAEVPAVRALMPRVAEVRGAANEDDDATEEEEDFVPLDPARDFGLPLEGLLLSERCRIRAGFRAAELDVKEALTDVNSEKDAWDAYETVHETNGDLGVPI